MSRTLLVTNDFPPRRGGIQSFVYGLARRFPADDLVVYSSTAEGAVEFDAEQDFTVIRDKSSMLLPTARVGRRAVEIANEYGCTRLWYGAAAPLGLLSPRMRAETAIERIVGLTHGHEAGWASLPVARGRLRAIADGADVLTYLGEYTRSRIAKAVGERTDLRQLTFGVDTEQFHPSVDASPVRQRWGLRGRPVIVCVSRLVPRKGQDILIEALPRIQASVPKAALLLVGQGPYESTLRKLAAKHGVTDDVVFAGLAPEDELAAHYRAGDVFAMPCRTRRGGLDVEGLGAVFAEAAGCALPVVVGDSGGAPAAVDDGHTGFVVDGRSRDQVTDRLVTLLTDRDLAAKFGQAGREWVAKEWTWEHQARRLFSMLGIPQ
ncbi:glycosyltransferase family 4 protein [Natronoglycomyces albus]|uniref:Glycosyltransferase family 4 protein n=1 Tax=Natronoglycomyces albus TaxID=2811108 RepID=A0A895XUU5_9ACTN|nr:glycosyltransferase family 4 protein [Natronoglycomyces albus]QSB06296.1 glycosyltransferase family 4 protein [Natronoglycomyces albus]